jgi:DNA polymerase III subunit delta'
MTKHAMPQPLPWHHKALAMLLAERTSLHHALLLTGPHGIGKSAFAKALVAALLCEAVAADGAACGECPGCHWFSQGNHPDFRHLQPEAAEEDNEEAPPPTSKKKEKKSEAIKIAQLRAAQEFLVLSSHRGGRKVLLIEPADALQPAAANALLKTLEEPPANVQLILISHQPARLLPTVRSRCRHVPLPSPAIDAAALWLTAAGIRDAKAITALTGGSPLLAQAWAQPEAESMRVGMVAELVKGSRLDIVTTSGRLDKQPMDTVIYLLQTWLVDLITVASGGTARFHLPQAAQIERLVVSLDVAEAFRSYQSITQSRRLAQHPLNSRLFIEQLLISYVRMFRA